MSELPQGWTLARIPDVLAVLQTGNIIDQGWSPKCEAFPSHSDDIWAALKTTAIQDGWFEQQHTKQLPEHLEPKPALEVRAGDLLLTCAGPRVRCGVICKVDHVRPRLFISGKMYRFRPNEDAVDGNYLLGVLRSPDLRHAIDQIKTGGNESGLNLTQDRFMGLEFPLPPIPEQRRIVKKLETLSARSKQARTHLTAIKSLVGRYKQAVLKSAFCGDLTADWRAITPPELCGDEYVAHLLATRRREWIVREARRRPDLSEAAISKRYRSPEMSVVEHMPALPVGWRWVSADALSTKISDGVHKKPDYVAEGVPFIMVRNLTDGPGISFHDTRFVAQEDHEEYIKRTDPERDDILISKDGTLGVVRRVCTDRTFSIFVSVALVKPAVRSLAPFLEYAFQAPQVQEQMVGVGSGLQHIHLTDLRKDLLPIAPPCEQREIVRRIETAFAKIDRVAAEAERALELTDRLDQRILVNAFVGQLVRQDPSDEPAAALLARIRAERGAAPKAKRGRKGAGT